MSVLGFHGSHSAWRKINYRRARQLLTAEFLHRLYARHEPFLNSFHFAETAVTFRDGQAVSYAPTVDWETMTRRFGGSILRDPDRVLTYLGEVVARPRTRTAALAERLRGLDLRQLDDDALLDTLCAMQTVPLGEVYELNFVQAEFGLQAALRHVLEQSVPAERSGEVLAALVHSSEHTAAGRLELTFLQQCAALHGRPHPASAVDAAVDRLHAQYAELGAGYGAPTATRDQIRDRLLAWLSGPAAEISNRIARIEASARPAGEVDDLLADLPPLASALAAHLRAVGELRDRNKALLGTVTQHVPAVLDEIYHRRQVTRAELDHYLLGELCDLLERHWRVPSELVRRRAEEGVVLQRAETASLASAVPALLDVLGEDSRGAAASVLRGLCASPGRHRGVVRVVSTARDLDRMQPGDVLVAPGTDFDMMLLLQTAGAVVVEEGGVLSHPAVISRELGVPCVLGVADATTVLRDGETVEVDAERGLVTRLDRPGPGTRRPPVASAASRRGERSSLVAVLDDPDPAVIGMKAAHLAKLGAAGLPVPQPLHAVPAAVVQDLRATGTVRTDTVPAGLVAELRELFGGRPLNLRSSSLLEDTGVGSSAGMFHSRIAVPAEDEALREALAAVLVTPDHGLLSRYVDSEVDDGHLSILVSPYENFEFIGAAFSRSPFGGDDPLVELFQQSRDGTAAGSGVLVEATRNRRPARALDGVGAMVDDVMALVLRTEAVLGGPAELEWGARDGRVTVLQGRLVVDRSERPDDDRHPVLLGKEHRP